jgi:hypothetical protein
VRERFFTPRLRFKTYDELNAWLPDQCNRAMRTRRGKNDQQDSLRH